MTTTTTGPRTRARTLPRERRPFLRLEARRAFDSDRAELQRCVPGLIDTIGDGTAGLVRALVDYTVARQNADALSTGRRAGIAHAVLNRRRRAAGLWIQAIVNGRVDGTTQHSVGQHWIPQLVGTGPELALGRERGEDLIEYVRASLIARIADQPASNLLPTAHFVHAIEIVLAAHLSALRAAVARNVDGR